MITLEDAANKVREILKENPSSSGIEKALDYINNLRAKDNSPLSNENKQKILELAKYHKNSSGNVVLHDSDNSQFLKMIDELSKKIKK